MTVDEQIAKMIQANTGKAMNNVRRGFVLVTAGLVLAGAFSGSPVFYGIAAATAAVSFVLWKIAPHMHNAARGLKEGMRREGKVEISIHQWTDAEGNRYETYRGVVLIDKRPAWRMEFATPAEWQPAEGIYRAQIVFLTGIAWPVAVVTSDGLLYPRFRPERASVAPL
jgi:hypothetical protein